MHFWPVMSGGRVAQLGMAALEYPMRIQDDSFGLSIPSVQGVTFIG